MSQKKVEDLHEVCDNNLRHYHRWHYCDNEIVQAVFIAAGDDISHDGLLSNCDDHLICLMRQLVCIHLLQSLEHRVGM